jgi:electron transfer flavoprotein beta subunit
MKELKIIVCIKQISDTEGPPTAFEVNTEERKVTPVGIPPIINPFDQNALEAALRIKKDVPESKVIAISMGERLAQPVLRKALSAGADELILLQDEYFKDLDSYSTAYVLSSAIRKIGKYDLILTGRQAADWNFGQTGLILAKILQISSISLAQKVKVNDNEIVVEKLRRDGYEVVKASMPALVTVSREIGHLRFVSSKAIKAGLAKPLNIWGITDLEVGLLQKLKTRRVYELYVPERRRQCIFIEGQALEEKGKNLAIKLKEDGVI